MAEDGSEQKTDQNPELALMPAVISVLETPCMVSEIVDKLGLMHIHIVNGGYLRGYLDAMVDAGLIFRVGKTNGRRIYSRYPNVEFTHRRCPSCMRQLVVFDSDVGTRLTCPRCMCEMDVELSIGAGIQLKKIVRNSIA